MHSPILPFNVFCNLGIFLAARFLHPSALNFIGSVCPSTIAVKILNPALPSIDGRYSLLLQDHASINLQSTLHLLHPFFVLEQPLILILLY